MRGSSERLIPVSDAVVSFWRDILVFRRLEVYDQYKTAKRPELRFIMDKFTPFPDEKEMEDFRKNPWNLVVKVVRGAVLVNTFSLFLRKILDEDPLSWYAALYLAHSALDNNYLKYDRLLERPDLLDIAIDKDFTPLVPLPSTWNLQRWLEREKRVDENSVRATVLSIAQDLEGRFISLGYDFVSFFLEGYEKIREHLDFPTGLPPLLRFVKLREVLYRLGGVRGNERNLVKEELRRWGIEE